VEPCNNNEEQETGDEVSLGRLLKRSREERHIELDEAFRATMIRRHILEALENDRWDELPPEVFVKGFLKTYAGFLGLDKKTVLELYEEVSSGHKVDSEPMKQVSLPPRRWPWGLVVALLVMAFIASIAFLSRKDISIVGKAFQYLDVREPVEEREEEAVLREMKDQAQAETPGDLAVPESVKESGLTEVAPLAEQAPEEPMSPESGLTEVAPLAEQGPEEAVSPEPGLTEVAPLAEQGPEEALAPQFGLTAHVRSRTWIAIHVDDQPEKEYLFQPGETFTWEAHEGFDILVGNAGGIDFVLNGTEIGTLGAEGEVVRIRLPKTGD
jgi:cytoskeleton protein RodZ